MYPDGIKLPEIGNVFTAASGLAIAASVAGTDSVGETKVAVTGGKVAGAGSMVAVAGGMFPGADVAMGTAVGIGDITQAVKANKQVKNVQIVDNLVIFRI